MMGDMNDLEQDVNEVTSNTETAQPVAPEVPAEHKTWAAMTHLSAFVMFLGIPSVIGPVVLWAIKKEDSPYVDFHGKEAVNFNISFLIYAAASAVLILALVGVLLLPAVLVTWFVLTIIATLKASNGEYYRYPLTIRFIN